jgi:hypothetical protein
MFELRGVILLLGVDAVRVFVWDLVHLGIIRSHPEPYQHSAILQVKENPALTPFACLASRGIRQWSYMHWRGNNSFCGHESGESYMASASALHVSLPVRRNLSRHLDPGSRITLTSLVY